MKPDFALSLSVEGIALLHRAPDGWRTAGEVPLDDPDLGAALAELRAKAEQLAPRGFTTKLIIPNDQIRYLAIDTGNVPAEDRFELGAAALDGATPYAVEDLAFDIAEDGPVTHVAAVANETLDEAEAFATEHNFNPVSFVAAPNGMGYPSEPFFGLTSQAAGWTGPGAVEPDIDAIDIVGPAIYPAPEPEPAPEPKLEPNPDPEAEPKPEPEAKSKRKTPAKAEPARPAPAEPAARAAKPTRPPEKADAAPAETTPAPDATPDDPPPAFHSARKRGGSAPEVPTPVRTAPPPDPASLKPAEPLAAELAEATAPVTGFSSRRRRRDAKSPATADEMALPAASGAAPGAPAAAEAPATPPLSSEPGDGAGPILGTQDPADSSPTPAVAAPSGKPNGKVPAGLTISGARAGARPSADKPKSSTFGNFGANALSGSRDENARSGISKFFETLREKVSNTTDSFSVAAENRRLARAEAKAAKDAAKEAEAAAAARSTPGLGGGFPTGPDTLKSPQKSAAAKSQPKAASANPFSAKSDPPRPDTAKPVPSKAVAATGATAAAAQQPEDDEAKRMTIFGARENQQVRGKPRFLGLILTVVLLLLLAGVAAWAAVFVDGGLSSLLRRFDREPPAAVAVVPYAPETEVAVPAAVPDEPQVAPEPEEAVEEIIVIPEAAPAEPAPEPMADRAQADALYAATGIWTGPPETPKPAPQVGVGDVHQVGIDHRALTRPTSALPELPDESGDAPLPQTAALTPDGSVAMDAVSPESNPEDGAEAEKAPAETSLAALDPDVIGIRPRIRPGDLVPEPAPEAEAKVEADTDPATEAAVEVPEETPAAEPVDPGVRPRLRPESIVATPPAAEDPAPEADDNDNTEADEPAVNPAFDTATALAVTRSPTPRLRPEGLAARASPAPAATAAAAAAAASTAAVQEADDEPTRVASIAPQTVSPRIPSTANVARRATLPNAINLRRINLIGVYGTPSNRRALVRLQNGRYKKVRVGDRIDGGQIVAIGDSELRYQKNGRSMTLKIPSG